MSTCSDFSQWTFIQSRSSIGVACGGSILNKEPEEVYALVEEISNNSCQWSSSDIHAKKQVGMYKVEAKTTLEMKVDKITWQLETLMFAQTQQTSSSDVGELFGPDDESNLGNPWTKQIEEPTSKRW